MRGRPAAPITDSKWGLIQLSDRHGEFDADDEARFVCLATLLSQTLEALWELRNAKVAPALTT